MTAATTKRSHDPVDLSAAQLWAGPSDEREQIFAELRRDRPVSWQRPIRSPMMDLLGQESPPGYWAVTRLEDIVTVSRRAEVFSSATGGVTFEDMPNEVLEAASSILSMDEPRHGKVRRVVSSVFTPRRTNLIRDQIFNQARQIVDGIAHRSDEVEFVEAVSAQLPMWTVSEMIGIPEEQRLEVTEAAAHMAAWDDDSAPADPLTTMFTGITTLHGRCQELIDARRESPRDDLISALVQAEVDGLRLTDDEIRSFFVLLCVAGNDTTKQTTTHALLALAQHPEQRSYLLEDFDGRIDYAIEEFIRWASPVMTFRRTALEPFELSGASIEAGDKVVLFYNSGNRDGQWFDDPYRFDLSRKPNQHIGFGGRGPHYCLGSHVAKLQLKAIFSELFRRLPDIETVGEPTYLTSNFINGIKQQHVRFTPESR
ncbi:cytochrome P450 [Mycolicibacterium sp. P9-22]|uniref:cytochrome P450 n=1 Tax=Mycolicibacterium sp. P9-22 TaxID=2024613 RepID=UPI0011EF6232|nr:cytochrome P450 [Mycolicibacterium sp. P9-22]KAA0120526.1 cytochrome P450 [Mycolicibacterium sp. P9-22]